MKRYFVVLFALSVALSINYAFSYQCSEFNKLLYSCTISSSTNEDLGSIEPFEICDNIGFSKYCVYSKGRTLAVCAQYEQYKNADEILITFVEGEIPYTNFPLEISENQTILFQAPVKFSYEPTISIKELTISCNHPVL